MRIFRPFSARTDLPGRGRSQGHVGPSSLQLVGERRRGTAAHSPCRKIGRLLAPGYFYPRASLLAWHQNFFDDLFATRHDIDVSVASISHETGPLAAAAGWITTALLGSVASTVAIVAVAGVGLLMLTGRVNWRRAFSVVLGCFILFTARSIAVAFAGVIGTEPEQPILAATPSQPLPSYRPSQPPANYDPYAGAAVPRTNSSDL